jgi:hypothetical protein
MPRFSLKTLLISTTLISVGLGTIIVPFSFPPPNSFSNVGRAAYGALIWFGGGAIIGIGLFLPWDRPWLGALLSIPIQLIVFVLLFYLMVYFGGIRITD